MSYIYMTPLTTVRTGSLPGKLTSKREIESKLLALSTLSPPLTVNLDRHILVAILIVA